MCLARLILFAVVVGVASKFLGTGGTAAVALIMGVDLIYSFYKSNKANEKLSKYWEEQDNKNDKSQN